MATVLSSSPVDLDHCASHSTRFASLLDLGFASPHDDFSFHSYDARLKPESQPIFYSLSSDPHPARDAAFLGPSTTATLTRSLLISTASADSDNMSLETVPGSPPELSSSRSSTKSSSLHSTGISNREESNISHFEDISLADVPMRDPNPPPPQSFKPRPLLRTTTAPPTSAHHSTNGHLREAPNGLRANAARNNLARSGKNPRPRYNKPNNSSPNLNGRLSNGGRRTPSPDDRGVATSPRSPLSPGSPGSFFAPSDIPRPRRKSWQQTSRKTAKELEQEYHDSDEDIPDDAFVCNIPLSPRPAVSRSLSRSPEPATPAGRSRLPPPRLRNDRTQSWETAMMDLSQEVQDLTSKLETHAERTGSPPQASSNPSSSPPRPGAPPRSKTVGLPPLQRGDNLIDPLPISKEKERVLSRTRPSWLPPKSRKEEQKHLREYQRMMSSFMKVEKRRSAEQEERRKSKTKEEADLTRLWAESVIPDWDRAIALPATRQLWWRGCPSYFRGVVWAKAIGNELHLSGRSYSAALGRARGNPRTNSYASLPAQINSSSRTEKNITDIHYDIRHTFPSLGLFQPSQSKHQALVDLLLAYSSYRSDTGYVRGTASIAALLLYYIPVPAEAFVALANLLNRPMSLSFCLGDTTHKERAYKAVMRTMRYKLPRLHAHLTSAACGMDKADYLEMMCTTLFTGLLSAEETSRIWDIVVFEGDDAIVRAVIGVLARLEGRLYDVKDDVLKVIGWDAVKRSRGVDVGGEEELMNAVRWAGREERDVDRRPDIAKAAENATAIKATDAVSVKSA